MFSKTFLLRKNGGGGAPKISASEAQKQQIDPSFLKVSYLSSFSNPTVKDFYKKLKSKNEKSKSAIVSGSILVKELLSRFLKSRGRDQGYFLKPRSILFENPERKKFDDDGNGSILFPLSNAVGSSEDAKLVKDLVERFSGKPASLCAPRTICFASSDVFRKFSGLKNITSRGSAQAEGEGEKQAELDPLAEGDGKRIGPESISVIAEFELPEPRSLKSVKSETRRVGGRVFVLLDRIQDPGNFGTILRTCCALDSVDAVISTKGSVDPFNEKAIRASRGTCFITSNPTLVFNQNWEEVRDRLALSLFTIERKRSLAQNLINLYR